MARRTFLFTSESVCEGHPDKLCDQVSDAVLDACLEQDPHSHVACETCAKTGMVMIFGEITTKARVNYRDVVKRTIEKAGFVNEACGLSCHSCNILIAIEEQAGEILAAVEVNGSTPEADIGAGDQGIMFGYACDETPEMMPLSHQLATKLSYRLEEVRKKNILPWALPDGKTQVTVEYETTNGVVRPVKVHTVLISAQHKTGIPLEEIRRGLKEHVVDAVIPKQYMRDDIVYHLNPSGSFVMGGPHGDAGLTGRKIIVDTYGGWGAHGGGAFSGKDPTKVDRSAAYAARWIAKSLVCAGLCSRCLIQLSYAIGVAQPLSINIDTYNTGKKSDSELLDIVSQNFDLRPGCILRALDLRKPKYLKTAAHCHFGKDHLADNFDADYTWEIPRSW